MTITYENTTEDAVAAQIFRTTGSPADKAALRIVRLVAIPALFLTFLATFLFFQRGGHGFPFPLFAVMPGMMVLLFTMALQKASVRSQVRSVQKAKKDSIHRLDLGKRTISVRPDGLFVTADNIGENLIFWDAITGVHTEKEHLFIRWTGNQLVTIPRRAFAGLAQEAAFLDQIAHYRTTLPPLPAILTTSWAATPPVLTTPPAITMTPPIPAPATKSNAPWWSGQNADSVSEAEKIVLNQRNG